ncbi:MAG TPA: type II secretion system F family protein [Candidatus Paceibacterota bacterium]|nr:type II secretion system F family protein [Candidatus Paceibacterota bacterium]
MNRLKEHFNTLKKKTSPQGIKIKFSTAKKSETKAEKPAKPAGKRFGSMKINLGGGLFSAKFSVKQQAFFAKRLSFLIKAGVPVLESMHQIRKQTKSRAEIKVFDKVIADVANGQSLATSLGRFRRVFGNFAVNIIRAGESSGTLTQNLSYLADELKKKDMLRKKIMSAMLYPIIITVATFGITGFLTVYIFPKIIPIFQGMQIKLPATTRIVIGVANFLRHDGLWLILGLVLFIAGVAFLIKKVRPVKFFYHGLVLRVPLSGKIVKNYNLTNTMRTLGLLLKSGISLTESLHVTAETTENLRYKAALYEVSKSVTGGKSISEVLEQMPWLFPPMIPHMVVIGERSGNLSNTLIYLSEFYENEFEDLTKNLSSSLEPILMVIMGFMVGFVAISVITPIYEITSNLKH